MTTIEFSLLIVANMVMIVCVGDFVVNRFANIIDHIDWKYDNLIKYIDAKWELEHVQCGCSTVSHKANPDEAYKYVAFFIRYCPNAYKIYVNVAGHIVIGYEKGKFNYTTDLHDMFLEVFGIPVRLIQIYEQHNQIYVELDVGGICVER